MPTTCDACPGNKKAQLEFLELSDWFVNCGIDIFILETMNNMQETQVCLEVISQYNLPIWVSYNLSSSSNILSGENLIEGLKLLEEYPDIDPRYILFTDLHSWILGLEGFDDAPDRSNEQILEAIQMSWIEEQD
mgnify:CR=1 FL=1